MDLTAHLGHYDLTAYAQQIRQRVLSWLGLPVCIGIGRSKTEAKLANYIAKKNGYLDGICNLVSMDPCSAEPFYQSIHVNEVWGIGGQHTKKLNSMGIYSVMDFVLASPLMIRDQFSIMMHRTLLELHGVACIELEHTPPAKKQIIASRSFGQRIYHIDDLKEAMSLYVMDAVSRLREDQLLCGCLIGFVQSNPFDSSKPFYNKSLSLALPESTDNLMVISKLATAMIGGLYAKDIAFKKCGVILTCLEPKANHIYDMFTDMKHIEVSDALMDSMESIHNKFGKSKLSLGASMLPNRTWSMSRNRLTQNYFRWDQLLNVY